MNIWLIKCDLDKYALGKVINKDMKEFRFAYRNDTLVSDICIDMELSFFDDGPRKISNVIGMSGGEGITCIDQYTKEIIEKKYIDIIDFIPIKVKDSQEIKYLVNIRAINDAFDVESSQCRINSGIVVSSVQKYAFKENVLEYDIFNCYELGKICRLRTYCNDNYKKLIEDNNITGYEFIKIFEVDDK